LGLLFITFFLKFIYMKVNTMKLFYTMLALGILSVSPLFSQESQVRVPKANVQSGIDLQTRLFQITPIFNITACSNFLLPFGASEKTVSEAAKKAGLVYAGKEKLALFNGAYMLAFVDPENIMDSQGGFVTTSIIYIFTFAPKVGYFSFTARLAFSTPYYTRKTLESLSATLQSEADTEPLTGAATPLTCDESDNRNFGNKTLYTISPEKTVISITAMDFMAVAKLSGY
jgi:hypothetical protein